MIVISGIGWVQHYQCGSWMKKLILNGKDSWNLYAQLQQRSVLRRPIKNFERFDVASISTCYALSLALYDAGISYTGKTKQDWGLIGTGIEGSLQPCVRYFHDYITTGRKIARGNLFIYTLPTSPLAEAAIHFGFKGPLHCIYFSHNIMAQLIKYSSDWVKSNENSKALAVYIDEEEAICFAIKKSNKPGRKHNTIADTLIEILNGKHGVKGVINRLKRVNFN